MKAAFCRSHLLQCSLFACYVHIKYKSFREPRERLESLLVRKGGAYCFWYLVLVSCFLFLGSWFLVLGYFDRVLYSFKWYCSLLPYIKNRSLNIFIIGASDGNPKKTDAVSDHMSSCFLIVEVAASLQYTKFGEMWKPNKCTRVFFSSDYPEN